MAQNREQRFASASEMRKALHRTDQTSTIINRGEAQTILRTPGSTATSPTVALTGSPVLSTQLAAEQRTVAAGETTVVRPFVGSPRRGFLPWVLAGGALLLAVCVMGFYLTQKQNASVVQLVPPGPSPAPSQAATSGTDSSSKSKSRPKDTTNCRAEGHGCRD